MLLHEESVILTEGLDPFDLMKAIRAGFEEIFQIHCADALMDPAWLEEASVLARDKYAQIMPAVDDFSGRTHWAGDHNPAKTISARQGAAPRAPPALDREGMAQGLQRTPRNPWRPARPMPSSRLGRFLAVPS